MADLTVYLHRNPKTGVPFYVGIGDVNRPFKKSQRSKFWTNYYNKHGLEVDVLGVLPKKLALETEKALISFYGRRIDGGILVNLTKGGEGFFNSHSQETKKRLSKSHKGMKKPWVKGRILSFRRVTDGEVFYETIREASGAINMKYRTLHNQLTGVSKNKTNLWLV